MYISKGMVARPSTEELLFVTRCGVEFRLTGIEADLWLDGRFSFAYEKTEEQKKHLQHLARMNLVEYREETSELAQYQILTQCVLCQTKPKMRFSRLSTKEKELLEWICHAGLHLSVAELVYHYQIVDAYLCSLLSEHKVGFPANDELKAKRKAASDSLTQIVQNCRKSFSSFKPTSPELYKQSVNKLVNTVLPAWVQYRNTYINLK